MIDDRFLDWRINQYSKLYQITRTLNNKAETALFLRRLNSLIAELIQKYGYDNVKAVVTHTIIHKQTELLKYPSIISWANEFPRISVPQEYQNTNRSFYELVLRVKKKTLVAIANLLIYKECARKEAHICRA